MVSQKNEDMAKFTVRLEGQCKSALIYQTFEQRKFASVTNGLWVIVWCVA